jgi:Tol biopolymer transport system component
MINRFVLLFFVLILLTCSQKSEVHYPSPAPLNELITFLPNTVCTDSLEFNSLFSPDGKSFYFSKYEKHDIYESKFDGNTWNTPVITPFSEKEFKECDPAFSPDGKKLFYISTRKRNENDSTDDFDIWFVEKQEDHWSAPRNLNVVNSDSSEFYVSFASNGNLYFASNREGGFGSFDIYVSYLKKGAYTKPVNLGPSVNNEHFEHDPFISKEEDFIIFTSANREDGYGKGDLYYSLKDKEGNWSKAKNLGPVVNSKEYEFCPYLSPDGSYFFLTVGSDVKWIDSKRLFEIVKNK